MTCDNDEPDAEIHPVLEETFEYPFLVIDLSATEHVEDLQPDEDIEDVGKLSAGTPFSFLEDVKWCLIPIVGSSWIDVAWTPWVLQFLDGFWEPVITSEHNGVDYNDLIDGIFLEMMYSSLLYGGLLRSSFLGGSVARARAPRESMIKLTHSS